MPRRPGPLAAIGLNVASLALTVPTVVVLTLVLAGAASSFFGFGLLILAVAFAVLRGLAGVQRRLVSVALDEPVTRAYADLQGLSPAPRVRRWITDRARWADAGWGVFTCTVGALMSAVALAVALYPIWSVTWFVLWQYLPANLPQPYHFLHVARTGRALAFTVLSVFAGVAGIR